MPSPVRAFLVSSQLLLQSFNLLYIFFPNEKQIGLSSESIYLLHSQRITNKIKQFEKEKYSYI